MANRAVFVLGASLLLLAGPAMAHTQGWYLGLGAGWHNPDNVDFSTSGFGGGSIGLDDSAAFIGAIGYKWPGGLRLEVEGGFANPDATGGLRGDIDVTTLLANLAFDVPLGERVSLTLGGGAGIAWVDPSIRTAAPSIVVASGSETAFAWQAIAGLIFPLSDRFELQADYRYRSIEGTDHSSAFFAPSGISFDDLDSQSVMVTLRWYFRAAEPPPPQPAPAMPVPPVKTFIVFFDFDKSSLNAEAQKVVAEAVETAKRTGMVRILITGHTDTVGSRSYNQDLSERRADSVKSEMVRLGMNANEITTVGKGFSEPLVPTGQGVREPQNRRAVIDLGG
jgi:outer membrane protein OmpA-like peptidoglycan-associated protein